MRRPLSESISKETLREWLKKIFMLCDTWDLEDSLRHEFDENDDEEAVAEYAADFYIDDLYPLIFDHFEFRPYMSGHDEDGEFPEHEFLYGDAFELDFSEWEHTFSGDMECALNEVFYLVDNGEIAHCMSFHFKSRSVEFTHEYELEEVTGDNTWLDASNVCAIFDGIIKMSGGKSDGEKR